MRIMRTGNERLSVFHAIPLWLPLTETWLYDQIIELPDWVESHVAAETVINLDQFPFPNLHSFSGLPWLQRGWDRLIRKLRLRNHLGFFCEQARKTEAKILHSHFGNVAWANRKVATQCGMRHIATFYGLDVNHLPTVDPRWRARFVDLFADISLVLCEGPFMAASIVKLGCPEDKVRVHHLGVRTEDLPFRPRRWHPGETLRVLIAASFREKKGIPYAIAALGVLQREMPIQIELTVIGDSTGDSPSMAEKERIMAALESSGLKLNTRFLGFCPYETLMQEAYKHHIFLSPSVTASNGDTEGGAPIGILHMAASGMPVVSTRHCDIPNLLPVSARLAEERDVQGLAGHLRWLVENPVAWEPQLVEARERVNLQFNSRLQGLRLANIYDEVTGCSLSRGEKPPFQRSQSDA